MQKQWWIKILTSNLVPSSKGRKVESISSIAAGWKNLRELLAMYPMHQLSWLEPNFGKSNIQP